MRVFFDFTDGSNATRDVDGQECGAEQARIEVLRALPEVLLGNFQDTDDREVTCSARDEAGSVLYRASVTLRGQRFPNR